MIRKLALVAISVASLGGTAIAQDAKAVIANAQKALGYVNARILLTLLFGLVLTPLGLLWRITGKDPLVRKAIIEAESARQWMRDTSGDDIARDGNDEQHRSRRIDGADAWNVLSADHGAAGRRVAAMGRFARVLPDAVGVFERRR